MRILFSTYPLAFQNPGGGEGVLQSLRQGLIALGHSVEVYSPWKIHENDLKLFDIIHYFSSIEISFWKFLKTHAPQTPLVVTPTLNVKKGIWSKARYQTKSTWQRLSNEGCPNDLPDFWLPTTQIEADSLVDYLRINSSKMSVLSNGVDRRFSQSSPLLFNNQIQTRGPFLLHVGRFHPVKNHLVLIEAIKRSRLSAVFIGSPNTEHLSYYEECRLRALEAERSDPTGQTKILLLTDINHQDPLLPSAYRAASAFALPSQFETFGIAALEAAVSELPLVLTKTIASYDLFKSFSRFVDPNNIEDLSVQLQEAIHEKDNPVYQKQRAIQARLLMDDYDWNTITKSLEKIYREFRKDRTQCQKVDT